MPYFKDRRDAGRQLAKALRTLSLENPLLIGLPRGGVVVAAEIARLLKWPLDVVVPRKLGAPHNEELAIGALAGEELVLDRELISALGVGETYLQEEIGRQKAEAARRLAVYRAGKSPLAVEGRSVVAVDDGIATGSTLKAALAHLRRLKPKRLLAAVPVAPPDTAARFRREGEEILCLYTPPSFMAVGQFYESFEQTSNEEVVRLLAENPQA